MKILEVAQRSPEWYEARLGKPTASRFGDIFGFARGHVTLKDSSTTYEAELVGEKIFGRVVKDTRVNEAMQYGIDHEDEAAEKLWEIIGPTEKCGFMIDDYDRCGCSPDRILIEGNRQELVEIKCPQIPQQIKTLIAADSEQYKPQIQGQLLISQYDCCHFFSYRHDCPPYYEKVMPDRPYMAELAKLLDEFCARVERNYQKLKNMEGWKP